MFVVFLVVRLFKAHGADRWWGVLWYPPAAGLSWLRGWGTPETSTFTERVSYGYPGGMNVKPINQVVIPPMPE
jgi:hypothetical protein